MNEYVLTDEVQEFCKEIEEQDAEETEAHSGNDDYQFRAHQPAVMDNDIVRQKGDLTIYGFYARSFQLFHGICWLLSMALTAAGEVLSGMC